MICRRFLPVQRPGQPPPHQRGGKYRPLQRHEGQGAGQPVPRPAQEEMDQLPRRGQGGAHHDEDPPGGELRPGGLVHVVPQVLSAVLEQGIKDAQRRASKRLLKNSGILTAIDGAGAKRR